MDMLEKYKEDPCGTLSIPYWKNKHIRIPDDMRIVHDGEYAMDHFQGYSDEPYFRLFHPLTEIQTETVDGIAVVTVKPEDIPILVDIINRSYTDLSVTAEQLEGYTRTEVYCPELWVAAVDEKTSCVVGCAMADFDKEAGEGSVEWVQVLPAYRRKKIGQLMVNELLKRMAKFAEFATVSGKVNGPTSPERLYRKCGFVGNDVWHILTKQR